MSYNFISVVLAAGKGTRMNSSQPKVLVPLQGKPLLMHVLDSLQAAGSQKQIIVVGYRNEEVKQAVQDSGYENCHFILQREQLGTGHALLCAAQALEEDYEGTLLVAAGDVPLLQPESFQQLAQYHAQQNNNATVLTTFIDDPQGYGRIVRDTQGNLEHIVEEKEATPSEQQIKEINSGTYAFQCPHVFSLLRQIGTQNAQNEYYLPDLVKLNRANGGNVGCFILKKSAEAHGINSLSDLDNATQLICKQIIRR